MHATQQATTARHFAEEAAPGLRNSLALDSDRLVSAKAAYSVRRVNLAAANSLLCRGISPRAGDLVLARVTQLGQHQHLESGDGRRARLWLGDEIVVAYAARYAPDQYEAYVPDDLSPCSLVAAGGIAARVHSRHASIRPATQIDPVGLLADRNGDVLNVRQGALGIPSKVRPAFTIAVVGSSMNAGKTTTAASLIAGLRRLGHRVGAAKVTGTGAGGDRWLMADAGASPVLDFTDAGYASTAGLPLDTLELILSQLSAHVASAGAKCLVIEVADGLLQAETAALLQSTKFAKMVDAVIFAAPDAMSVLAGADWLHKQGLPLIAVSGVLTMSPLAMREAMAAVHLPVYTAEELTTPRIVSALFPILQRLSPGSALGRPGATLQQ